MSKKSARRLITVVTLVLAALVAAPTVAGGNTGFEGQPGNQSSGGNGNNGNTGYEGRPGNQGGGGN